MIVSTVSNTSTTSTNSISNVTPLNLKSVSSTTTSTTTNSLPTPTTPINSNKNVNVNNNNNNNNNNSNSVSNTPQNLRSTPVSVTATPTINGSITTTPSNPISIPYRCIQTPPNSITIDQNNNYLYSIHPQHHPHPHHHQHHQLHLTPNLNNTPTTNQHYFITAPPPQPHQLQFTPSTPIAAASYRTPIQHHIIHQQTPNTPHVHAQQLQHHHPHHHHQPPLPHSQVMIDVTSSPLQQTYMHTLAVNTQMPSQTHSPSATSNSELQSLDNEQNNISNNSNQTYQQQQQQHQHQQNHNRHHHHHHHHHYQNDRNNNNSNDNQQHTSKTNLYIRGLSQDTTDNDLHEMCKGFGQIKSTKAIIDKITQKCKGYGFVDYINPDDAIIALRELKKEDKDVQLAKQREQDPTNLYFANLPSNIDEKALTDTLQKKFNVNVNSTRIMRERNGDSKGVGFARIEESKICDKIIQDLNNKPFPGDSNTNKLLLVKLADSGNNKKQRNSNSTSNSNNNANNNSTNSTNGYTSGTNSMNNSTNSTSNNTNIINNSSSSQNSVNTSTNNSNNNTNTNNGNNSLNNSNHFTSPKQLYNGIPIQIVDAQHNQLLLHPHHHTHPQIIDPTHGANQAPTYIHPHHIIHQIPQPHSRAFIPANVQYASNTPTTHHTPPSGIPYLIIQSQMPPQHQIQHQIAHMHPQQAQQQQQQQQNNPNTTNTTATASTQQQQQQQQQQQNEQQNANNSQQQQQQQQQLYPIQQFANMSIQPHQLMTPHGQQHLTQCVTLPNGAAAPQPHHIQIITHPNQIQQTQQAPDMYTNNYTNNGI